MLLIVRRENIVRDHLCVYQTSLKMTAPPPALWETELQDQSGAHRDMDPTLEDELENWIDQKSGGDGALHDSARTGRNPLKERSSKGIRTRRTEDNPGTSQSTAPLKYPRAQPKYMRPHRHTPRPKPAPSAPWPRYSGGSCPAHAVPGMGSGRAAYKDVEKVGPRSHPAHYRPDFPREDRKKGRKAPCREEGQVSVTEQATKLMDALRAPPAPLLPVVRTQDPPASVQPSPREKGSTPVKGRPADYPDTDEENLVQYGGKTWYVSTDTVPYPPDNQPGPEQYSPISTSPSPSDLALAAEGLRTGEARLLQEGEEGPVPDSIVQVTRQSPSLRDELPETGSGDDPTHTGLETPPVEPSELEQKNGAPFTPMSLPPMPQPDVIDLDPEDGPETVQDPPRRTETPEYRPDPDRSMGNNKQNPLPLPADQSWYLFDWEGQLAQGPGASLATPGPSNMPSMDGTRPRMSSVMSAPPIPTPVSSAQIAQALPPFPTGPSGDEGVLVFCPICARGETLPAYVFLEPNRGLRLISCRQCGHLIRIRFTKADLIAALQ